MFRLGLFFLSETLAWFSLALIADLELTMNAFSSWFETRVGVLLTLTSFNGLRSGREFDGNRERADMRK